LWESMGKTQPLLRASWPQYDPELAKEEEVEIPVQVNGKLRGRITVAAGSEDSVIRERALADSKVQAAVAGKQIVKVIIASGRLVSIVVK